MGEFHLPKSAILKEIYIREIPLILYRMKNRQRSKTLEKLYDNLLTLRIAAATAGLGASIEMIKDIQNGIEQAILRFDSDALKNNVTKTTEDSKTDSFEKLEQLQGLIANTRKGMRTRRR